MIYLVSVIAYLMLLAGIAVWKSREVKQQSDFAVAGRSLSPWVMVCTMLAAWIGTGSILGNAEQTYETGMAAMLLPLGSLAGMALLSLIATRVRNLEASTVPEILARRFGPATRNLAMLSLVIAYMVIVSYQFNAGGAVLEVIAGDRAPVPVSVGDRLSREQLRKARLRFTASSDPAQALRFAVRSADAEAHELTIDLRVAQTSRTARADELPDQGNSLTVPAGEARRIRFGGESLAADSYTITEIPAVGTLELVEPLLTARGATLIAAAFIITYAALAGLMSLAWMDLVTGTIIMLTMVISFIVYWSQAGGWPGIKSGFVTDGRSSHLDLWGIYTPTQLVNYILPVFLLVLGDANQYQRIFASRTGKGARTAVTMLIFIAFAIELLVIACAWIASSMTPNPEHGKYILIYAARHYLALPLGCLFMVTVVGIIISTADSFLHVPATTVVNDFYLTYVNPKASHKRTLLVSRGLVVVFGIIAYAVTLMFSESTGFFKKALYAFTIYGASITPAVVAALLWKRATRYGALASIASGAVITLAWNEVEVLREMLPSALAGLDAVLPALTVSVTVLIVVSLCTSPARNGSGEDRQA